MQNTEFNPIDDGGHARQLADRITKFWAAQGYEIAVTITRERGPHHHFAIRTNLVNGLPVGFRRLTTFPRTVASIPLNELRFHWGVK